MRIFVNPPLRVGNADLLHHLNGDILSLGAAFFLMQFDGLDDLVAHGKHGVEAGHRLLKDHRDVIAAHLPHLSLGQFQ